MSIRRRLAELKYEVAKAEIDLDEHLIYDKSDEKDAMTQLLEAKLALARRRAYLVEKMLAGQGM